MAAFNPTSGTFPHFGMATLVSECHRSDRLSQLLDGSTRHSVLLSVSEIVSRWFPNLIHCRRSVGCVKRVIFMHASRSEFPLRLSPELFLCGPKNYLPQTTGYSHDQMSQNVVIAIPTEISAATILITFWDANVSERSKTTLTAGLTSILTQIPFGSQITPRLTSVPS